MNGKWITCRRDVETPRFQKTFILGEIESAEIAVTGLGWFTLLVNGQRVTEDLFTPALTDYAPRNLSRFGYPLYDTTTHRVLYLTYDITRFLHPGENTVDVIVGNGWFRQTERIAEGKTDSSEELLTAFEITVQEADGTVQHILSDGTERCFIYPILQSNLFIGETVDTRLFDSTPEEVPVLLSDFVPEHLDKQDYPADRVIRQLSPVLVSAGDGRLVYDAGENISGLVRLQVKGGFGEQLVLRYAEEMKEGALWFPSAGANYTCASGKPQIQCDTFILNGEIQTLLPMFVFHGFRYFEIIGTAEISAISVLVIHTDIPVTSDFSSSSEALNWLYDAYIRTQLANFHNCIPSDCPHRERLGYTGDGQLCAETAMLTLGSRKAYRKWIRDILDCQDIHSGHIQHTAPLMGGGGGPGGWGGAIVFVPYQYWKRWGDTDMLRKAYEAMKRWIVYMTAHSENHLVVREEEGGWCLGEWAAPEKISIPPEYVNTCFLVRALDCMAEIADVLQTGENDTFRAQAETCRQALESVFAADGHYVQGVQGADAFAVWARLPHWETAFEKLCEKYEALGHLDTGMFGTDYLMEVLFRNGRGDLALRLMASENTEVGFNFMRSRGATTIYEYLSNELPSHNHPMFGACVRQLFTGLLGIQQRSGTTGYTDLIIAPFTEGLVDQADGYITTQQGRITVSFVRTKQTVISVTVPAGISAVLRFRGSEYALQTGENHFSF